MKRLWLQAYRQQLHLTQAALAEAAQISRAFYTQIELGQRTPSPKVAKRLAQVLSIDWTLFYESDVKPS